MKVDGATLRRLRKKRGLTMQELGKAAEVGPITIGRLEKGCQLAQLTTVRKLAEILEVDLSDLLVNK